MDDDSSLELRGGPYDIDFFFDPACPFAWQTSVWLRRVMTLRHVRVGWRFLSLEFANENEERPQEMIDAHQRGLRYLRICAAARQRYGNDAVGALYRGWGERFWYGEADGDFAERLEEGARLADPAEIVRSLELPADLVEAAEDSSFDELIRAETDEAFRRTGHGVGTPIVTFDPPNGNSLFGPIISSVPDDAEAVEIFDALRVVAGFTGFSELKRTIRPPLDLPLLAE